MGLRLIHLMNIYINHLYIQIAIINSLGLRSISNQHKIRINPYNYNKILFCLLIL
nr:MAG TPA: hypothetical protein [Caudoviricetes sp.]